jgi:hypothetical protein
MKDEGHEVLPDEGSAMRDVMNQCNEGKHYERGRDAVALGTTKGAKTKKKRGVTGSGDGWRDTRDYPTREALQETT